MRYRYIAYKYTRRGRPDAAFQSLWDTFGAWPGHSALVWRPAADVYETPDYFVIIMELAGVAEENVVLTLFSDLLVIEGSRQQPELINTNACHQLGIKYGDFKAEIPLHTPVDHDNVQAELKNGMLTVMLVKR